MLTAVLARMRRSGPGWVGGYVMDRRDTVIGLPRAGGGLSQTRPGLQRPGKGVERDVPQPKTHVGGAIRRHGSSVS